MRSALRQVLLMLVLLPALAISLFMSIAYGVHGMRELDRAFTEKGLAVVRFLAPAAEFGVVSGNRASLDALARAVLEQPDVAAVGVFDRDGRALVVSGLLMAEDFVKTVAAERAPVFVQQADRMVFSAPVVVEPLSVEDFGFVVMQFDDWPLGWVQIELSTARLDREKQRLLAMVVAFSSFVLAISVWLAMSLSQRLTQSFGQLASAVDRLSKGDLDVSIKVDSGIRELQTLQLGFNRMARSIGDARHDLQQRIDEATRQLAHLAMHDALTGLPNRRAFEEALEEAIARSRRAGDNDALCFIDLDRFKQVNDSAGHAAGDALLRKLAVQINREVRASDTLYRIGGDEFVLVLRACSRDEARRVAQKLCDSVSSFEMEWQGQPYSVGASIGLVRIDPRYGAGDILRAADKACYQAKAQGRNQVCEVEPRFTDQTNPSV